MWFVGICSERAHSPPRVEFLYVLRMLKKSKMQAQEKNIS